MTTKDGAERAALVERQRRFRIDKSDSDRFILKEVTGPTTWQFVAFISEDYAPSLQAALSAVPDHERALSGRRKSPAWHNELPEYRDAMRRKAGSAIAAMREAARRARTP